MSHVRQTVLVTRPLEASQQLAGQIEALGLTPVVMPLYTFSAREPGFDVSKCWSSTGRKLAVFTSPRAVQFGLPYITAVWPAGHSHELELAVVGSATRVLLEASGYPVHLQSDSGYTSEDLLQLAALAVDPGEAVIFCAPGGRETLAEGLAELGWKVSKALVYERQALQPAPDQTEALENAENMISVWTSVSAVDLAHEQLSAELWQKILTEPALVISLRIQHHLQQLGATHIELTDGPGNPELLSSIVRLIGQRTNV